MQRVPRQEGALRPNRKPAHARQRHQTVTIVDGSVSCSGHQIVYPLCQSADLGDCFASHDLGHQRRRGDADGATVALEGGISEEVTVVGEADVDRDAIAAERVVAFGVPRAVDERPEVARISVVVEDTCW